MNTYTFTDRELEILRHAMMVINDIEEDTALENVSEDLFPSQREPIVLTAEKAKVIREELITVMNRREARHSAMRKLNVPYNEETGYSA